MRLRQLRTAYVVSIFVASLYFLPALRPVLPPDVLLTFMEKYGGSLVNCVKAEPFKRGRLPHALAGGFGTVGAGLRAGKPTIVCPFFSDQPFWGRVIYELGVGPKPIPQKRLSAEGLARAIDEVVSDKTMQQKASKLGEAIRAEDGVDRAVEAVNMFLANA